MKVILNQDVKHLGEEGDVKVVANGYARNYLFPRNFALPYNDVTVAYFESRKEEIEKRKEQKRHDAASLKEKLEALEISISMPAGSNGKLFGAVTSQTIADYFAKNGLEIERKRIDISGLSIKSIGKYTAHVRLYESELAEIVIHVLAQEDKKSETKTDRPAKREAVKEAVTPTETPVADEKATSEAEKAE